MRAKIKTGQERMRATMRASQEDGGCNKLHLV
jgi:hypothetical protein